MIFVIGDFNGSIILAVEVAATGFDRGGVILNLVIQIPYRQSFHFAPFLKRGTLAWPVRPPIGENLVVTLLEVLLMLLGINGDIPAIAPMAAGANI